MIDVTLPDLGENVTGGDVLRVLVKAGDPVAKDQIVLELETDKATLEVPSSVEGLISDVKVRVGDTVTVGQPILTVEEHDGDRPRRAAPETADQPRAPARTEAPVEPAAAARTEQVAAAPRDSDDSAVRKAVTAAAPSVRRMARELGVDIAQVTGTGPGGRISTDDVKARAKRLVAAAAVPDSSAAMPRTLPDFSRWGPVDRRPMSSVRRKTAEHVSAAWAEIPHVTQHDVADITSLEVSRARFAKEVEAAGGHLTVTAVAVRIAAAALGRFPQFNTSIDPAANEIIYKKYVHVGVAVDTDRGLLVPVIRDAGTKGITQIAVELSELSTRARAGTLTLEEMQGGTFTVSNLGGLGGTAFTPIVNAPEVAILGLARARMEPVYRQEGGQFVPRLMLPLSLSYDHRLVDGADGVRFLRWIAEAFEQPFRLALVR